MWNDFKKFIQRGNVLDLAIGVIIGAAFTKIVDILVEGIIMPPIGYFLTSRFDFSSLYYDLSGQYNDLQDPKAIEAALKSGAPLILYGQFITNLIQFLIVAFVVFLIARWALRLFRVFEKEEEAKKEAEKMTEKPSTEEELLTEIRDILKEQRSA